MFFCHNSREARYRSPFGAAAVGTAVTLSVTVREEAPQAVLLRLWTDHETFYPMSAAPETPDLYTVTVSLPETPGLVWYYFCIDTEAGRLYYGKPSGSLLPTGEIMEEPESWQITVYEPTSLPEWYRTASVYQIFPDRFARGDDFEKNQAAAAHPEGWKGTKRMVMQDWDDTAFYGRDLKNRVTRWPFFGGSFRGIQEKLPYLKSLGIGAIYLNPIFLASSNHKYDTADYLKIDPTFGTEEDFTALCTAAKEKGIRIILDGVFSHTGDDSIYFNRYGNFPGPGAFSSEPSDYDSWYRFGDYPPCGYECWWGVDSLPNVEETNPGYQELICGENGVIRKWLRLGASGWRLDVADELPDSFIAAIRSACKAEKEDALLLGEVWEDASHKISYNQLREYFLGRELDCTMHYPFRDGAADFMLGKRTAGEFALEMDSIRENYPPTALYGALNLIGSHDTVRILSRMGEAPDNLSEAEQEHYRLPDDKKALALRRLKLLQVLQFAFPGVPCVYYGDEAGMEGYADPFNRQTFPWGRENGDLQFHVRMLSHLRQEYPVLVDGDAEYLAPSRNIFGVRRTDGKAVVLCYVNRDTEPHRVKLPEKDSIWLDLLSGREYSGTSLTLGGLEAVLLYHDGDEKIYSPLPAAARTPNGEGVLLPLFSLPNEAGVGTMGPEAYEFIDRIAAAGYQSWMLLPLCPIGNGNSPYSSRSLFAGDPRLISDKIETGSEGYDDFYALNRFWLEDHALYTVLRRKYKTRWQEWPKTARDRTALGRYRKLYAKEIEEEKQLQYRFHLQWKMLKEYAGKKGVSLIGDLPIYAARDSADTWAHRELFQLDDKGYPILRAGCPPDYFDPNGQDWGNPLYNWERMQEDDYTWWGKRLEKSLAMFDYIRLDHFRGFASYYAIPRTETAKNGVWMKGPGLNFFRSMQRRFTVLPVIAEDLGTLDSEVTVLLKQTGLSGMNVWQFNAEEMLSMAPEAARHRVFFSGTHDNQTLKGCLDAAGSEETVEDILKKLCALPAAAVIIPVQDLLGLGDEARINVPGVPEGNWHWQLSFEELQAISLHPALLPGKNQDKKEGK